MRGFLAQTVALCSLAVAAPAMAQDARVSCDLDGAVAGVVAEVVDARTLRLADGDVVRLVGVLAPEPGSPEAAAARRWLEEAAKGQSVRLAHGGRRDDRRGRRLAHVLAGAEGRWLQGGLVEAGLARAYSLADNRACIEALLDREAAARRERRGIWQTRQGRLYRAERPDRLLEAIGSYAVVEGRILSIGDRRLRTYLNFGTYWNEDFTVVVTGRDRDRFAEAGIDLTGLSGSVVRVRGWVLDDRGPAIEATHPEQIEFVEER